MQQDQNHSERDETDSDSTHADLRICRQHGTAILAAMLVVALMYGTALASTETKILDDFEDGDKADWTVSNNDNWDVASEQTLDGDYSLRYVDGGSGATSTMSLSLSQSNPKNIEFDIYYEQFPGGDNAYDAFKIRDVDEVQIDGSGNVQTGYDDPVATISNKTWYTIRFSNFDWQEKTYTFEVLNTNTGKVVGSRQSDGFIGWASACGCLDKIKIYSSSYGSGKYHIEEFRATYSPGPIVSGTVTASNNDTAVSNALVEFENATATRDVTTDTTGAYSVSLPADEWNITVSKSGYANETDVVNTTDGQDEVGVNFELTPLSESLRFDAPNYIKHGRAANYTVVYVNETGSYDVTDEGATTVTSRDSTLVSIDPNANTLTATLNTSRANETVIDVTYTDASGQQYALEHTVTVANATTDNIDVLPLTWSINAVVSDSGIQVILVATMMAAAAALFSTSFGGLVAGVLTVMVGWFGGYADTGIMLIALTTAIFIGLNVAANIDYAVGRG